jgi:small subunit ribosomal protein S21
VVVVVAGGATEKAARAFHRAVPRERAVFCPGTGQGTQGESMPLRMRVHEREPIGMALRRFKKLLERSGITKELRKRKYYEKPCELRRRAQMRRLSSIRKGKLQPRKRSF